MQNNIDLLVTDVVMPQMSGRELVERLRAQRPDLRVIYVSGYTNQQIIPHTKLGGGLRFLQKPFSLPELANLMRDVLEEVPRQNASSA